jgi:peptidylprolyl isomerase
MTTAKMGDTVRVEYVGKLDDGTVFDSSKDSDPLEFTLGEGAVIPGFENANEGMEVGETLTTTVEASDAYGVADPRLKVNVPHDRFPDDIDPQPGQHLQVMQQDGNTIPVTVVEVADEAVTLDANHPLAGEDLTFEITLVSVDQAQ